MNRTGDVIKKILSNEAMNSKVSELFMAFIHELTKNVLFFFILKGLLNLKL
jgi:hypothetical protein